MKTSSILSIFLLLFFVQSCKQKSSAGLGGNANLIINAKHHGLAIDSCTIYVKFNSVDAPSNLSDYDLSQTLILDANNISSTTFKGLKKGDYYIYGQGWDPSIAEAVKGGLPYTISEEKDMNLTVSVTED